MAAVAAEERRACPLLGRVHGTWSYCRASTAVYTRFALIVVGLVAVKDVEHTRRSIPPVLGSVLHRNTCSIKALPSHPARAAGRRARAACPCGKAETRRQVNGKGKAAEDHERSKKGSACYRVKFTVPLSWWGCGSRPRDTSQVWNATTLA